MHDHTQPTNTADSAGFPWEGRSFEQQSDEFKNDQGLTPPDLARAIAQFREGSIDLAEVLRVFAKSRVLIPLLTVAGDLGETPDGRVVDKTQELSIVTVQGPDGRSVLPVFSSVEAMSRWNPDARPVPNYGQNVAVAALSDGNDLVVLDPMSPDMEFGIRRPALFALVEQRDRVLPWEDQEVIAHFQASLSDEPAIRALELSDADPTARLMSPEVLITLTLEDGLDKQAVEALVGRLQAQWAASEVIAARVDSMMLRIQAASTNEA